LIIIFYKKFYKLKLSKIIQKSMKQINEGEK
jgi:hypothetical protein